MQFKELPVEIAIDWGKDKKPRIREYSVNVILSCICLYFLLGILSQLMKQNPQYPQRNFIRVYFSKPIQNSPSKGGATLFSSGRFQINLQILNCVLLLGAELFIPKVQK